MCTGVLNVGQAGSPSNPSGLCCGKRQAGIPAQVLEFLAGRGLGHLRRTMIVSAGTDAWLPVADNGFAYSIHLYVRMLPCNMFVEIVSRSRNAFIDSVHLVKQLRFPLLRLPVMDRFVGVAWLQATVRSLP